MGINEAGCATASWASKEGPGKSPARQSTISDRRSVRRGVFGAGKMEAAIMPPPSLGRPLKLLEFFIGVERQYILIKQ